MTPKTVSTVGSNAQAKKRPTLGYDSINPRYVSSLDGWHIGNSGKAKILLSERLFCAGENDCTKPTNPSDQRYSTGCHAKLKWTIFVDDPTVVHIELSGTHGLNFVPKKTGHLDPETRNFIFEQVCQNATPSGLMKNISFR
jgi:hypothetical protein